MAICGTEVKTKSRFVEKIRYRMVPKNLALKHGMTLKTDVPDLTDQFFGISHNIRLCIFWANPSHGMAWHVARSLSWCAGSRLESCHHHVPRNKLGSAANAEIHQNT